MTRTLIDLSMEVYKGMMTYPNVAKPVIVEMESHSEMARSVGTDQYGVDEITNHCMIVTGDHIGTHIDSWGHVKPDAPRAEGIPIDYCYGDGVVLDLTHKRAGEEITPGDIDEAERKLDGYRIKALDIVLLRTDAAKQRTEKSYLTNHPGMTNLHEIPAPYHSFIVSVLPVKWRGASAAPVRAVAIIKDPGM
jgi:kynurenine formamidase